MLHLPLINFLAYSPLGCVLGSVVLSIRLLACQANLTLRSLTNPCMPSSVGQPTAWTTHQFGVMERSEMNNTFNQFVFFRGYSFRFEDDSNVIEAWFSSISGLEKVKVNTQLVAEQRNLSTNSSTSFEVQGTLYNTNIEVKSLFKGPFVCSLFKNGELFKQQRLVFLAPSYKTPWYGKFWFTLLVGLIFAVSSSYVQFSLWVVLAVIAALCIVNIIRAYGKKLSIEEIELARNTEQTR